MANDREIDPSRWMEEHGDILYRFALARIREPSRAEDLVQETFLAAMKAQERFSGRSTERTWLIGILKHKIIDLIRKSSRETLSDDIEVREAPTEEYFDRKGHWKVGPPEWITNPTRAFEQKEFYEILADCMSKLPPQHHAAFTLRELEGHDAEEICKTLNITSTNLWVILYRARLQLKKCLEINWLEKEKKPALMSCEEIAKLTSQSLDSKLTLGQRLMVKLHYWMCYCPICKHWLDQLTVTQEAFRKLEDKLEAGEAQTDVHLPDEARTRILDRCNKV